MDKGSHLCGHTCCKTVGHVVFESNAENESRKNCMVWINCPHAICDKRIWICEHEPRCVKAIGGRTEGEVKSHLTYFFH